MNQRYEDMQCPLPNCGFPLYITWHASRPVFISDTTANLANPEGAYTTSWEIGCEEGHTLLLPLDSNDSEVFGGSDNDDEIRPELKDLTRLHRVAGLSHD